jgi:acetyltransferase
MSIRNLDALLAPTSVAVFGASKRIGSVGALVWHNLRTAAFSGVIYPVNPKHRELDGVPVFASTTDLPSAPELAILCTPPKTVPGLIAELAKLGTRAAIVVTAGLSAAQKQAMLDAARPHLLRVLGPNCLGLLNPKLGLNASFAHTDALPGELAFVSQSGALLTAVLDWAKARRIGFSKMISIGESADVDFGDLLDYLASDANTRAILLYIESIKAPAKFMSAARAAARNKPVIVVKAGRAGKGLIAAASHTGALAGSDLVFDAAIRRAGMLRVDTLTDLFMAAETLAHFASNKDKVLTMITNGGGAGVMAADAADLAGVALYELSDALKATLNATLPPTWSGSNPIDIIGDAPVQRYTDTLAALLAEPESGAILFMHAPTAIVRSADIARACAPLLHAAPGRVLACWLGGDSLDAARQTFQEAGAADYDTPEAAVRAFALLATYRNNQNLLLQMPSASEHQPPDVMAARSVIETALLADREMLDEVEAKAILKAYGIPVVATMPTEPTAQAALIAAKEIGYPVALKILSHDISHKSDVGGVRLNLRDANELQAAADTMLANIGNQLPQARIHGFTVQAMAKRPMAQELILGLSIDPIFGPILLFGQGGTAVEVLADRAIALPPLNRTLAQDLMSRTRVAKLLAGYRDHPPADLNAIADVLIALSQMLADLPELSELDINPLWADHNGVLALDARVRVRTPALAGASKFAITPYPAELVETVMWRGEPVVLRPIKPEDSGQHLAFLAKLEPEDLRLRIFSTRRELAEGELARLTQIDYAREMAFIAVQTLPDGSEHTLGTIRVVIDPDNRDAELAIIVRSDVKRLGLGQLLLTKLIDFLKGRGTERMIAEVFRSNDAINALLRANGFDLESSRSDDESRTGREKSDTSKFVLTLNAGFPADLVSAVNKNSATEAPSSH